MKINIQYYQDKYHYSSETKAGKLIDNWREGIKLLPFTSNPGSAVDKNVGLAGATGAFFRLYEKTPANAAIEDSSVTESLIRDYLKEKRNMPDQQVDEFIEMWYDLMFVNGSLNVTDRCFLKYIPLVPQSSIFTKNQIDKYKSGQKKLAEMLMSFVDVDIEYKDTENNNLFTSILKETLVQGITGTEKSSDTEKYYILPFIKKTFNEDLTWLLELDSSTVVRYVHLFTHFYVCYAITQTLTMLSPKVKDVSKPTGFYFILSSEKVSVNHDAIISWNDNLHKTKLDKIFGKSQALDILNSVLGGDVGFYPDVLKKLEEEPFSENKELCEELLSSYQTEKRKVFNGRDSEDSSIDEINTSVESYEEFFIKLDELCRGLQSPSYISRMRKKVIDLLSIRFLQLRKGNYLLVLDNEMLVFLVAMFTKNKRVKLEDLYKTFNSYGIYFNRGTRIAIESYLLKLHLLERKSDAGEAEYVRVIL